MYCGFLLSEAEDADGEGDEGEYLAENAADCAETDMDIEGKPGHRVAVFPRAIEVDALRSEQRADSAEQCANYGQRVPEIVCKRESSNRCIHGVGRDVCDHQADAGESLELAVVFLYKYIYYVARKVDCVDYDADAACVEEIGCHKQQHTDNLHQKKRNFVFNLKR